MPWPGYAHYLELTRQASLPAGAPVDRSPELFMIKENRVCLGANKSGGVPTRVVGLRAKMLGVHQPRLDRRQLLALAGLVSPDSAAPLAAADEPLRFGLTPVFLDSDVQLLAALQRYLEDRLDRPVELVKRRTYQEITLLLLSGQLDAAWICGFPFVQYREQLALVAVPLIAGSRSTSPT